MVGAASALAGVLISQGMNQLQERQRAARERRAMSHAARQDLYSRFVAHIGLMTDWVEVLNEHWGWAVGEVEPALDHDEWYRAADRLTAEINLVGSKDVVPAAAMSKWFLSRWCGDLETVLEFLPERDDGADSPYAANVDDALSSYHANKELFERTYAECLNAMRVDLGVSKLDEPRASVRP